MNQPVTLLGKCFWVFASDVDPAVDKWACFSFEKKVKNKTKQQNSIKISFRG